MIPFLTIDEEFVQNTWKDDESSREWVTENCDVVYADNSNVPLYTCDDSWVKMGVFNEYKQILPISEFYEYGYCDTEDALLKYLQSYVDDKDNNYFVTIGTMSMDYEKYYKNGTYINKDGVDTKKDYYDYIDEHPQMEVEQDFENKWITFTICKLTK